MCFFLVDVFFFYEKFMKLTFLCAHFSNNVRYEPRYSQNQVEFQYGHTYSALYFLNALIPTERYGKCQRHHRI